MQEISAGLSFNKQAGTVAGGSGYAEVCDAL